MIKTALALILFGVLARLVPHPPNASPLGALSLYAGARLPRRWSWLVPLAAMLLSDALLDYGTGRPFVTVSRLVIYATYAAITVLSSLGLHRKLKMWSLPAWSFGASAIFFLTTNFISWLAGDGSLVLYPHTLAGLVACFVAAIPFFGNTVLADLGGTAVLFGSEALALRVRGWVGGAARPVPLAETTTPVD
jgi:hypothetical protein